jgi:hypothetical protein
MMQSDEGPFRCVQLIDFGISLLASPTCKRRRFAVFFGTDAQNVPTQMTVPLPAARLQTAGSPFENLARTSRSSARTETNSLWRIPLNLSPGKSFQRPSIFSQQSTPSILRPTRSPSNLESYRSKPVSSNNPAQASQTGPC